MKSKDIVVGEEYEVVRYGSPCRARVLAVGTKTRRVHSSARWDTGGHDSTGVVVTVRFEGVTRAEDVVPGAVKRLWSEAAPEYDALADLKARSARAANALQELGLSAHSHYQAPSRIDVVLDLAAAEALIERLS